MIFFGLYRGLGLIFRVVGFGRGRTVFFGLYRGLGLIFQFGFEAATGEGLETFELAEGFVKGTLEAGFLAGQGFELLRTLVVGEGEAGRG